MQHLKRLGWLFLAGFVAVAGGSAALILSMEVYGDRSEARAKQKYAPDPRDYLPPKPGEVVLSDLRLAKLTVRGGVYGYVENHTKRPIRSFNADLSLSKNGQVVHRCKDTASVDVGVGARSTFQLLCSDLDATKLTEDMEPTVSINWVYPSLDR